MEKPTYLEYLKSYLKLSMFVNECGLRKFVAIIYLTLLTETSIIKESGT